MCRDRHASTLAMVVMAAILLPTSLTAQITFQRTYGGADNDLASWVQQTSDDGYVIAGWTGSYGAGGGDAYLIKTNGLGDTQWTRTYGGADYDDFYSVEQTADGGYILAGETWSFGADDPDIYLVKTDANGDTLWTRTFGGAGDEDYAYQVQQTADSGYVLAGYSYSDSAGRGSSVVCLIRTDAGGDTLWTRTFGGTDAVRGYSLQQTTDGGYIIAGEKTPLGIGWSDVWLIKTDANGDTLWTRTFGGDSSDEAEDVRQTADGGYIIAGDTRSYGAGAGDLYLIRTDPKGDMLWSSAYGGASLDFGSSALQVDDGTYAIVGVTASFGAGGRDFYLIKTDADGDTLWTRTFGGASWEYASSFQRTTDGGYVIAGHTASFGAGGHDIYLIKTDSLGNVGVEEPQASPMRTRGLTLVCEPNPCRGATTVSFKPQAASFKPLTLRVYDASGCLVHSTLGIRNPPFQLDLRSMPAGAYFIRLDASSNHATTRVVLQR
jgi:hypothetical protein